MLSAAKYHSHMVLLRVPDLLTVNNKSKMPESTEIVIVIILDDSSGKGN